MTDARATFASRSDDYAAARPRYPDALYAWILEHCPGRNAAWDCATGNGQAAIDLSRSFDRVEATDISREQVHHGLPDAKVIYSAQAAERTDFDDDSFDLITVAQALHWFDYDAFWPEVRRVAAPGAFFCAWGYAWFEVDAEVESRRVQPIPAQIQTFWAPNNGQLWRGYDSTEIRFPFERVDAPAFDMRLRWTVPQLTAYMRTWSAYKRACEDPDVSRSLDLVVADAEDRLPQDLVFEVRMPLAIVAGRVDR